MICLEKKEQVICIDPGPVASGVVFFDGMDVTSPGVYTNESILHFIEMQVLFPVHLAIEGVSSYGMPVGKETFDTVEWIGRFSQKFGYSRTTKILRREIKLFLCGTMAAKDKNVRRSILDIFPATGGGKIPQVGTKKQQGPLYGVTSHAMSALAVGLTYHYGGKYAHK